MHVGGSVEATGTVCITDGAGLAIDSGLFGGALSFTGLHDMLTVGGAVPTTTAISGFVTTDSITVQAVANGAVWISGVLQLRLNGVAVVGAAIQQPGSYASTHFDVTAAGGFLTVTIGSGSPGGASGLAAPMPVPPPRVDIGSTQAVSVAPISRTATMGSSTTGPSTLRRIRTRLRQRNAVRRRWIAGLNLRQSGHDWRGWLGRSRERPSVR